MATVDEELVALKADLDAVTANDVVIKAGITGLQTQVTTLNTTVAALQTQLAGAGLTAEQQAALTAAVTEADSVKASTDMLAAQFPPVAPAGS